MHQQIVNEKENEKAAIDVVEEGIHQYKTGSVGVHQPTIEDSVYYADQQYSKNTAVPDDGKGESSAQGIAKSPMRFPFLWGPSSPDVVGREGKDGAESYSDPATPAQSNAMVDRRALRKVTVFGAFYLITTDILGPFNTGYAFSQVGFAPGVILYVVFGVVAFYTGLLLNSLYLRLDSDRSPIRNYGQLAYRILGPYGKMISDIFMIVQLVVNCGTLLLSNAQSLAQVSRVKRWWSSLRQRLTGGTPLNPPDHRQLWWWREASPLLCHLHPRLSHHQPPVVTTPHAQASRLARKRCRLAQYHSHLVHCRVRLQLSAKL